MKQINIENFNYEIPEGKKVIGLIAIDSEDIMFCMNNSEFQKLKQDVFKNISSN